MRSPKKTTGRPWFAIPPDEPFSPPTYSGPALPRDATGAWVPPQWAGAPYRDATPHPTDDAHWTTAASFAPTERLRQVCDEASWMRHVRTLPVSSTMPCWSMPELAWIANHPAESVRVLLVLLLAESSSESTQQALAAWRAPGAPPLTENALFGTTMPAEQRAVFRTTVLDTLIRVTAQDLNRPDGPLWSWSAQLLQIEDGDPAMRAVGDAGDFTIHPWLRRSRGDEQILQAWWLKTTDASPLDPSGATPLTWDTMPQGWSLAPWVERVKSWLQQTPLPRAERSALGWHSLSWPLLLAAHAGPLQAADIHWAAAEGSYSVIEMAGNPWADRETADAWWNLAIDLWGHRSTVHVPDHALTVAAAAQRLSRNPTWHLSGQTLRRLQLRIGAVEGWTLAHPLLSLVGEQPDLESQPQGRLLRSRVLEYLVVEARSGQSARHQAVQDLLLNATRGAQAATDAIPRDPQRTEAPDPTARPTTLRSWLHHLGRLSPKERKHRLHQLMGEHAPSWLCRGWVRESMDMVPLAIRTLTQGLPPDQWPTGLASWCLKAPGREIREVGLDLVAQQGESTNQVQSHRISTTTTLSIVKLPIFSEETPTTAPLTRHQRRRPL